MLGELFLLGAAGAICLSCVLFLYSRWKQRIKPLLPRVEGYRKAARFAYASNPDLRDKVRITSGVGITLQRGGQYFLHSDQIVVVFKPINCGARHWQRIIENGTFGVEQYHLANPGRYAVKLKFKKNRTKEA